MERQPKASYLQPGTVIDGKYEVQRVLGAGAMGAVVEATHLLRRARVALKFMSQEMADRPGVVDRFLNEGVAASRINNDHVVKVLDVSRLPNGQPYLVMEFLEGEDLANLLTREGPRGLPDVQRAIHFILQVLRGLQVAHQVGIIHRDLKPANCFVVTNDGEPDYIKLVDFGISKVQEPDTTLALTSEGASMGTPLYVSPEQARDAMNVDARSDLYSVSAMLYELLCGRTPFDSPTLAGLFMQLATATPKPLNELRADLPPGLAEVVQKGLAKLPDERYQSASEMAWALSPYADARSEVVIRQLVQRSSIHAGRLSSSSPPLQGSSAPPLFGSEAMIPRAPLAPRVGASGNVQTDAEARGTAPGVVRVARRETAEAQSVSPKGAARSGLRSAIVPVLLLAVAGAGMAYVLYSGHRDDEARAASERSGDPTLSHTTPAPAPEEPGSQAKPAPEEPADAETPGSASAVAPAERPSEVPAIVTPPKPGAPNKAEPPRVPPPSSNAGSAGASSSTPAVSSDGAAPPAHDGRKPSLNKIGLQD